jgi:DNA-binding CsgD family transcriptional regulator
VAGGVGGVLLVVGEQGIGKSTLLREGLAEARGLGCWVGWGVADELLQRFPLGVMVECLGAEGRRAVAGGDGGGVAAGGEVVAGGGVVAWVVAGGVEGAGSAEGAGGGSGFAGPVLAGDPVLAGVERLLAVVDRLCAVSPVVVVVEDLQWADEASLVVWRRLSRAVGQLPLLVVGSLRPVLEGDEVARLVREVTVSGGVVVEVGPLGGAEAAVLAGGLLGGLPGRGLAGVLARAGGNPLYVGELADALVRDGRVRVAGGEAELVGEPGEVRVPVSLAAAIGERLAGLAPEAVEVLRWAAVLGVEFSVPDLGLVTGWPAGKLAGVVERALAAGVVAQSGSRLGFRHGLIRQALYEGVPESVREALHAQAARALAGAGAPVERVAAQLVAAPAADGEWVWAWLAGAVGMLAYRAPRIAAELLRRGLAQIPAAGLRREVLETALVNVAGLLMQEEEVERVARPLLARTTDPDRAAEVSLLFAYSLSRCARPAEAAAVVTDALARPGISPTWVARLRARQAIIMGLLGQWDRAEELAGQALAGAERTGDRFAAGYALHILSFISSRRRDLDTTLSQIGQALRIIADDPETTDLRLLLLANKAAWLENSDRMAEADATVREAMLVAEQSGTPRLGLICTAAADYYIEVGQWDEALTVLETTAGMPDSDSLHILRHGQAALIAAHRDDWEKAQEHLDALSEQSIDLPAERSVAYCLLRARALAAEREGKLDEAVAVLAPCLDPDVAQDMQERYLLLPPLTRLALAAGDTATAVAAAQGAAAEAALAPLPVITAAARYCQGLADGDPEPVLAAAAYYKSAGRPFDRAQALEEAAVLLAANGDGPAAKRAFGEAARLYADLGAAWDLRRADARLRRYGIRRGRGRGRQRTRPAAQGWEALTPTEAKIARLVATGRSNPDIAAELFLSRNTVQTHVSHILAKLGAHSRAEIIREALRRQPQPR